MHMNISGDANTPIATDIFEPISCRETLRSATQGPHERLHLHAGFSAVKDGIITLPDYRALLTCLYGFYLPFERAVGAENVRTQWLESDLMWLGVNPESFPRIRLCPDIPRYGCEQSRLGALYVVEGSALGGRQLCRGLDRLLGADAIEGRRFFAGRGDGTGAAWRGFLDRVASVDTGPISQAALVSAAVETFGVFETWLSGWSETE
jgi:heme oxygenase